MDKFSSYIRCSPQARAQIKGNEKHYEINGEVLFRTTHRGVLVTAQIEGLPRGGGCENPIFGFHIHEGDMCSGNSEDPFKNVGGHYNPLNCPHPYHAGDMPPLFTAGGFAYLSFLTSRFTVDEIIGRTVIIHGSPDDFTTQPSGNAGMKIACGKIKR